MRPGTEYPLAAVFLTRIPKNGSDPSKPSLLLNLARTLRDSGGLPGVDPALLAESQISAGEAYALIRNRGIGALQPSPEALGTSKRTGETDAVTSTGEMDTGTPARRSDKPPKRSAEASRESGPMKRVCQPSDDAVPQENLAIRVSCVSSSASTDSVRTDAGAGLSIPAEGDRPRVTLKPKTAVYQLSKAVEEIKKMLEESEADKLKLQEEVDLLNKRVAVFREIFQDTDKLKAVLNRLNIRL